MARSERKSVLARGVKVSYLTSGIGPKNLVLVHGLHCTPYYWQGLMEALPEKYHCVATDHFVDSDRPWGGWNASGLADEVRDLIDALGMQKIILGGHSLGGIIAQLFALRYQERLEKLLLVGTGASLRGHGTYHEFREKVHRGADREDYVAHIAGFFSRKPAQFDAFVEHALRAKRESLAEALLTANNYDFTTQIKYIQVPTLICHGTLDLGRRMEHARELKEGIPNSKLMLYEAAHAMMVDKAEEFNRDVLAFLEA